MVGLNLPRETKMSFAMEDRPAEERGSEGAEISENHDRLKKTRLSGAVWSVHDIDASAAGTRLCGEISKSIGFELDYFHDGRSAIKRRRNRRL